VSTLTLLNVDVDNRRIKVWVILSSWLTSYAVKWPGGDKVRLFSPGREVTTIEISWSVPIPRGDHKVIAIWVFVYEAGYLARNRCAALACESATLTKVVLDVDYEKCACHNYLFTRVVPQL
jgi:hypothetical protein